MESIQLSFLCVFGVQQQIRYMPIFGKSKKLMEKNILGDFFSIYSLACLRKNRKIKNVMAYFFHILQKAKNRNTLLKALVKFIKYNPILHYSAYKIYHSNIVKLKMDLSKKSILIYTGVKTGSSTIYASLNALGMDIPIYHIHFLTHEDLDEWDKIYRESYSRIRRIPEALLKSQYLRKQMDKGVDVKEWKIIACVRDPIAQHISYFIYMIDVLLPPKINYQQKIKFLPPKDFAEELIDLFLKDIDTGHYANSSYLIPWFDLELKRVFGIDVCSIDFPKSKGYQIYRGNHPEMLLYKLEALSNCAKQAFKEFLNIENFTLKKRNIACEKKYASVYQKFLDLILLPESYISKMYSSKYVQHFYSAKEINDFKAKWRKQDILT